MMMMMMMIRLVFLACVLAAAAKAASSPKIDVGFDRPGLRLAVSEDAPMRCCYTSPHEMPKVQWIQNVMVSHNKSSIYIVNDANERVEIADEKNPRSGWKCSNLILKNVAVNDTGLYQCGLTLNNSTVYTPGTFLQVYEPTQMILGISESSKNSIITVEGIFLLLFVLLPGITLICKSKGLNELEKRKGREEENIYEGLNLDDCNSTYHQIQRSLVQGPYQDVINNDDDDIQLEKP